MIDRTLNIPDFRRMDGGACGWAVSPGLTPYPEAAAAMEARAEAIARGEASELVWLLEHPPLYTAGVSARDADLLDADRFPVFRSPRGGQYTYHGPGQRVAYVLLDLRRSGLGVRDLVCRLEQAVIDLAAEIGKLAGPEQCANIYAQCPLPYNELLNILENKITPQPQPAEMSCARSV